MDIEGEAKLVEFLNKEFNGWPILNDSNWNDTSYDPMETLIKSRFYGYKQLLDVFVSNNPKDPKYALLRVGYFLSLPLVT
jgi:hypothetical protein